MSLQGRMEQKIRETLKPEFLEIINESAKHQGHAGHDGSGESHYKLKIASKVFEGLSRLEMQRLVYKILEQEMSHIHALSLSLSSSKK